MKMHVDINEDESTGYEQLNERMQKAVDRGAVAMMFKKYWKLQNMPIISDLNCKGSAEEIEMNQGKTPQITDEHDAGNIEQETVHCE